MSIVLNFMNRRISREEFKKLLIPNVNNVTAGELLNVVHILIIRRGRAEEDLDESSLREMSDYVDKLYDRLESNQRKLRYIQRLMRLIEKKIGKHESLLVTRLPSRRRHDLPHLDEHFFDSIPTEVDLVHLTSILSIYLADHVFKSRDAVDDKDLDYYFGTYNYEHSHSLFYNMYAGRGIPSRVAKRLCRKAQSLTLALI